MTDTTKPELKSGEPFFQACTRLIRWKAYKPGAPKNLIAKGGRWQEANEHGGWDNCEFDPENYKPPMVWQPIETAPKDGTQILLSGLRVAAGSWGICRPQKDGYVANDGVPCWRTECGTFVLAGILKRWMPLPPPPVDA